MVSFVRGRSISTTTPTVAVDAGLPLGTHRFQLVVVSASGQASAPAIVDVAIARIGTEPLNPNVGSTITSPVRPLDTTIVRPRAPAPPRASPRAKPPAKPRKPRKAS